MPGRKIPLITGEVYHVFNRGIDRRTTFTTKREFQRAVDSITFYRFLNPPIRLSKFLRIREEMRLSLVKILQSKERLVEIYSYCFMPNHFHFLLKQCREKGISSFLSNFQNSYTRYFNTRHKRDGSLFLDQFKAVRIETDEQFIHVSRYIHLNPYTGYVVSTFEELMRYPWSSLPEYILEKEGFVDKAFTLHFFKESKQYGFFLRDQADYQRSLKKVEHLLME